MNDTESLEALMRRFTPKQRAKLTFRDRLPKWLYSNARFFALVAEYDRDSRIRYWQVLSRVTSYDGPDYHVRLVDRNGETQRNWVRASPHMYAAVAQADPERARIGGEGSPALALAWAAA